MANSATSLEKDFNTTVETIDQQMAAVYLKKAGHNRPLSPAHLLDLEGRQRRGEWKFNAADSIVFDTNDELRNGQHRLHMVVSTGISMEALVVRNAPVDSFLVYDDGKKRSIGDVLFINGEGNSILLGEALRHIWLYLSRAQAGVTATKQQLTDLLKTHPTIRDSVAFDVNLFGKSQLDRPVITGMHWLFRQVDPERGDRFISQYLTGLDYDRGDGADASYVLREMISRYHMVKSLPELTRRQKMALFVNAFDRAGESTKHYRMPVRTGPVPEIRSFPKELYLATSGQGMFWEDEGV